MLPEVSTENTLYKLKNSARGLQTKICFTNQKVCHATWGLCPKLNSKEQPFDEYDIKHLGKNFKSVQNWRLQKPQKQFQQNFNIVDMSNVLGKHVCSVKIKRNLSWGISFFFAKTASVLDVFEIFAHLWLELETFATGASSKKFSRSTPPPPLLQPQRPWSGFFIQNKSIFIKVL